MFSTRAMRFGDTGGIHMIAASFTRDHLLAPVVRNASTEVHSDQLPYRELLEQIYDCDQGALEPMIEQWLRGHPLELAWLAELANASPNAIPKVSTETLWRLYALSRVSDALIALMGRDSSRARCYTAFMEGLGLHRTSGGAFHPFYHEVVTVTPSAVPSAPIQVTGVLWPGFMCGPLMIARAGVSVVGGTEHIRKDIAETSTLYWSYRRAGRPREDRSVGWGHNSQWRTTFRRDYCVDGQSHYNVDGSNDPGDPVLEEQERLELVRHRCFVLAGRAHANLYPYELRHSERMGT